MRFAFAWFCSRGSGAPSGVCTPTRYGLITGRYPWRTCLQALLDRYRRQGYSVDRGLP
jgi:arylsulfatase A-like enzyme